MGALKNSIKERSSIIEEAIKEYLPMGEPKELYKASRHLIMAGGKRLRPVTAILATEAVNGDVNLVIPAAVAIETIHNFTLIHDDIMDDDLYRRGVQTVHTRWDVPTAILAGDTLFAEAFRILTQSKSNPERVVQAIHMLADVCVKICEGQHMDMSFEKMPIVKEKDYLEMIRKKTAVLYAASSSIGPLLNDCSTKVTEKMWKFGEYVGMGFQIYDDVLDLIGSKEKLGKDWGSDILQGKKTLVMIDALNRGVNIEIYGKKSATEEEIQNAVDILKECGSVDYSLKKARQLVDKGISQLDILEDSDAKRTLIELAEFLISREF